MSWQLQLGRPALLMDTLGFEPRAFRMRSGFDTTTRCALELMLLASAKGNEGQRRNEVQPEPETR